MPPDSRRQQQDDQSGPDEENQPAKRVWMDCAGGQLRPLQRAARGHERIGRPNNAEPARRNRGASEQRHRGNAGQQPRFGPAAHVNDLEHQHPEHDAGDQQLRDGDAGKAAGVAAGDPGQR